MNRSVDSIGRATEPTLNDHIAQLMKGMRRGWAVDAERTNVLKNTGERPDIVVRHKGRQTIIIENEFMPANNVEKEAKGRLGKIFKHKDEEVSAVIALRSPDSLKKAENLRASAESAEYEYALYISGEDSPIRMPYAGWLRGGIDDLAGLTYRASVPDKAVQEAAAVLQKGASAGSDILDDYLKCESKKNELAQLLKQEYGDGEQTRRMVMLILINALVFQYNLNKHYADIPAPGASGNKDIKGVDPGALIREWEKILDINYWPIFFIALNLLKAIPLEVSMRFIDGLCDTAMSLMKSDAVSAHDLSGRVFQNLISDRKYLATFYTRPASAALLANLAIPDNENIFERFAGQAAPNYRIADFACGTGALLSAAYRRIIELYEKAGGCGKHIHKDMMKDNIVGCDVMPSAVHLTTSLLSGMYSDVKCEKTKMYIIVYGLTSSGEYSTGSMDLLESTPRLHAVAGSQAEIQTGRGAQELEVKDIRHKEHDLVIMNPPFTRSTNHEGKHANVPNPAWAGFGMTKEMQDGLGERAKYLRKNTCGHGNAGMASDFVALGDKMVKPGGITAYILPLTALAGDSWKGVRELWAKWYEDITVVTLSSPDTRKDKKKKNSAFSADTSIAEVMVVCKKISDKRSSFTPPPPRGFCGPERASC